jgi:hypothetical protein
MHGRRRGRMGAEAPEALEEIGHAELVAEPRGFLEHRGDALAVSFVAVRG